MTESEKKAEEYANEKEKIRERINNESYNYFHFSEGDIQQAYKDGYKQGQKDNDNYHLPAIEQKNEIINQLEKENEELKQSKNSLIIQYEQDISELKAQIEKMKCCGNCTKKYCHRNNAYYNYCIQNNKCKWECAE